MKYFILFLFTINFTFSQNNYEDSIIDSAINLFSNGNFEESIKEFEKLKSKKVERLDFYIKFSEANFRLGNIEKSIEIANQGLLIDKKNYSLLMNLGLKYRFNRDINSSKMCYLKLVEYYPDDFQANIHLSNLLNQMDDFYPALKYAKIAFSKLKKEDVLYNDIKYSIAILEYQLDNKVEAKKILQELVNSDYQISRDDLLNEFNIVKKN